MTARSTMKKIGRHVVSAATVFSGAKLLSERLAQELTGRILCYHSISVSEEDSFAVTPVEFARQMEFIADHFRVLSVDDLLGLLKNGPKRGDRSPVAVTIDDGYEDAYINAYPVLNRLSIPATIFLPVGFIENGTPAEREVSLPHSDFLAWPQIREMSLHGLRFGSHTIDHLSLTDIPVDEIQHQLADSKAMIEAEIDVPVTGFAYPYGTARYFSKMTKQLVKAAGYSWAVSGLNGTNTGRTDPFELRRTKVEGGDGMAVFRRAVKGGLDPWVVLDRLG